MERLEWSGRVQVVTARAEDAARNPAFRSGYDLVTARSFAAPAITAECAVGFLTVGGRLVVSEPREGSDDRWNEPGLAALGFDPAGPVVTRGSGATIATLTLLSPPPDRYPRRAGIPTKRPLW